MKNTVYQICGIQLKQYRGNLQRLNAYVRVEGLVINEYFIIVSTVARQIIPGANGVSQSNKYLSSHSFCGSGFESMAAWFWLEVSHKVAVTSSEGHNASTCKVLAGKLVLAVGRRLPVSPHGPSQKAACVFSLHGDQVLPHVGVIPRKRKSQAEATLSCDLFLEVTYYHFCHFLFVRNES